MRRRVLSVDSETGGLDLRDELKTVQVWEGKKGRSYHMPEELPLLKRDYGKAFEDPNVIKIIHSSEFDIPMIFWHTGLLITGVWDTKLMESVILGIGMQRTKDIKKDPKTSTNLDLTLRRRGIAKLEKAHRELYYDKIAMQRYVEVYGERKVKELQSKYELDDVKYLEELMLQQIEDIAELELEEVAELENACAEVTAIMRINGIGFSERYWIDVATETQAEYDKLINSLPPHINWKSPAQVKRFFGKKGIRIRSYTDFWKGRTSSEIKPEWLGIHPMLDNFLKAQQYSKAISSYGIGWLTNKSGYPTVFDDSRVRCNFDQIVDTGRYSCSNPNLQQLPSKLKHRNAFRAAKGWTFCIGDYTGQELGIIAIGAEEETWIEAMLKGHDVHSVMGAKLHGEKIWNKWAEPGCTFPFKCKCKRHNQERRPIKDLNFGLAYGKGAKALAEDMGCTQDEAQEKINEYFKVVPRIRKWLQRNGKYGIDFKEAFTFPPFKRRRVLFEEEEYRRRNQGKNTPVQGTGGDILKLALVRMNKYIRKHKLQDQVKIVLCVHDEIITEVSQDYAKEWLPIMKRIMDRAALTVLGEAVVTTDPFINKFWPYKDQDLSESKFKQAA